MQEEKVITKSNPFLYYTYIALVLLFFSCNPPDFKEEKGTTYTQNFSAPVAFIDVERNGGRNIEGTGSGFLIDKEKGLMITNRHVTKMYESYGTDEALAFIDGRAYKNFILRGIALVDSSLVKLVDFDPNDLPEPYPISETKVQVGDTIYLRGFHVHPDWLSESNKADGFPDVRVPIIKEYYKNFGFAEDLQNMEVVYHDIKSTVLEIDLNIDINQRQDDRFYDQKNESNTYIKVETEREHPKITRVSAFGGLSGGVALNENYEIIGIITAQERNEEEVQVMGDLKLMREKYNLVHITPIENIKELLDYAKQVR